MRGAVAAGHPLTAQTGAEILAEGGNAVDACIAAAFVSWVTESPLTGPGAGGFMLVHRASDRSDRLLDFFVTIPGRGRPPGPRAPMDEVNVEFDPAKDPQIFLIGAASCAVPGSVAGLGAAHAAYARMPWADLITPAARLAREGIAVNEQQGFLHTILDPILRAEPEGRCIYGADGPLGPGSRLRMPDLGMTLDLLAAEGPETFYRGDLARALSRAVRDRNGVLSESDLADYRVVRRRPVRAAYGRWEFVSNPPPSAGGLLIAYALRILDRLGIAGDVGSGDAIAALAEVMREAQLARGPGFLSGLSRGGLAQKLLADDTVAAAAHRARERVRLFATEP